MAVTEATPTNIGFANNGSQNRWWGDVAYVDNSGDGCYIKTGLSWVEDVMAQTVDNATPLRAYKNSQTASFTEDDDGDVFLVGGNDASLYHISVWGQGGGRDAAIP